MLARKQPGNGKKRSGNGASASANDLRLPSQELEELLGKAFDNFRGHLKRKLGAKSYAAQRSDFIFHMTDWLGDLEEINRIFRDPARCDVEATTIKLIGILYHVIPHLSEAGRLLLDEVQNPFAPDLQEASKIETRRKGNGK